MSLNVCSFGEDCSFPFGALLVSYRASERAGPQARSSNAPPGHSTTFQSLPGRRLGSAAAGTGEATPSASSPPGTPQGVPGAAPATGAPPGRVPHAGPTPARWGRAPGRTRTGASGLPLTPAHPATAPRTGAAPRARRGRTADPPPRHRKSPVGHRWAPDAGDQAPAVEPRAVAQGANMRRTTVPPPLSARAGPLGLVVVTAGGSGGKQQAQKSRPAAARVGSVPKRNEAGTPHGRSRHVVSATAVPFQKKRRAR